MIEEEKVEVEFKWLVHHTLGRHKVPMEGIGRRVSIIWRVSTRAVI